MTAHCSNPPIPHIAAVTHVTALMAVARQFKCLNWANDWAAQNTHGTCVFVCVCVCVCVSVFVWRHDKRMSTTRPNVCARLLSGEGAIVGQPMHPSLHPEKKNIYIYIQATCRLCYQPSTQNE